MMIRFTIFNIIVVVVAMSYYAWDARPFMLAAMRNNMTDSSYVYIIPYPIKVQMLQPEPWTQNQFSVAESNVSDSVAKQAFESAYIVIVEHVIVNF